MKIQLPEKEWYTIDELAQRWECTKDDVLHYIQILVLLPSFYLDHVRCRVRKSPLDIDSLELAPVKTCTGLYSPLLFVNDGDIGFLSTRKQWECCLEESVLVRGAPILHDEDNNIENVEMFSPVELTPKTFDDFLISRKELQRFETKITKDAVSANKSVVDSAHRLHPRKERSLLTIINALLGVIDGGYPSNAVVKHPSIKNQSDLVVKIAEAKEPGMSKANLEKVFAEAKRQAETDQ